MNRRAVVAAVLVAAALGVGVARTVTRHDPGSVASVPAPVVTAAPSVLPAPASASGGAPSAAEPANEVAGTDQASVGVGRDTGPADGIDAAGRDAWKPVATGFARAFTTVGSRDTTGSWQSRLRPYVTTEVDKQLGTVDVRNVPAGRFDGLDVLDSSDEQVTAQATYSPGWALVLYLVSDGNDHWKVYRYDRLEHQ